MSSASNETGRGRLPAASIASGIVRPPFLPRYLAPRLPFFYGWVVLGCLCLSGFARQGPAVATLSVFIVPMTAEFGWSRAAIAGAVSLGGVLAAFAAPLLGPVMDRRGARLILCLAVLGTGLSTLALSLTLMNRLNTRDMSMLSVDRNVPEPLRIAARKRVVSGNR